MSDVPPEPGTIVELLERDHQVLKGLVGRFAVSATHEWGEVFRDLVDYLVRHEVAEEEIVYPALRAAVDGSDEIVEACVKEEQKAELRLIRMEQMSVHSPEFRDEVGDFRNDLLAHIAHEEQVIIPLLRAGNLHEDSVLRDRYEIARTEAPTRPEAVVDPDALSPSGLRGSLSSLIERLRETAHVRK